MATTHNHVIRIIEHVSSFETPKRRVMAVDSEHRSIPRELEIAREFSHGVCVDRFDSKRVLASGMYYDSVDAFLKAWNAVEVTA